MVRKVVSSSLGSLGYKTIEAISAPRPSRSIERATRRCRAVVLDMVMPGMAGGRPTSRCARRQQRRRAAMCGHTLKRSGPGDLDLGVRSFVTKPYSIASSPRRSPSDSGRRCPPGGRVSEIRPDIGQARE